MQGGLRGGHAPQRRVQGAAPSGSTTKILSAHRNAELLIQMQIAMIVTTLLPNAKQADEKLKQSLIEAGLILDCESDDIECSTTLRVNNREAQKGDVVLYKNGPTVEVGLLIYHARLQ